ncbi:MAG TPA: hypothetical protein VK770_03475 [Candidatus Acidoferrum sp.]|nr:hypothetical protein [Candidatus Acidoferrum sp.]
MIRKLIITIFAFLSAVPAFSHTSQFTTPQAPRALRLMNDNEFAIFMGRLDSAMLRSQVQLKKMDVQSLSLDVQEKEELVRSHERCLQSLENARQEIQKLLQKQTLKLDLFLLIDMNELARNLDSLDQGLVNTVGANASSKTKKSLAYAREVLDMDVALTTDVSIFQHHFLAFTGVIDATLDQGDRDASLPQTEK